MIEVSQLVKRYGPSLAVDGISFNIPQGQIVGFLGPNGAGKSTTLRILTGFLPPTSGTASVAGHNVLSESAAARTKIGYMPESTPLYPEMRVEEYLNYRGRLMQMDRNLRRKRIDMSCQRCGLSNVRRRLIGQLSRGNRQRVGLAQALLHDPPVLILDEPTAGLDPVQIGVVRELISELRGQHTIMISSHILPEVEKTADRVMIIAAGRIVADDAPDQLRRSVQSGGRVLVEIQANPQTTRTVISQIDTVAGVETEPLDNWCRAIVTPKGKADVREPIGLALMAQGFAVREMRYESATLEEFFIQITAQQHIGTASED